MTLDCPFCNPKAEIISLTSEHGWAIRDSFPISNGHTLIIPKLHIPRFFGLAPDVQVVLWQLVGEACKRLAEEFQPDGFNIGLNDGEAAGQTVMHTHIHIIPRWKGDVPDSRGGIRWIIPDKAIYWGNE
jgi:diadenosine tetraphosphate (Ap4A) HIT family hydrolase